MNAASFLPPLIAISLASCAAHQNAALTQAHNSYNSALTQPNIMNLADADMQLAGNLLNQADTAADAGANAGDVEQLAYLAKQQAAIAQEIAKRKTAEAEIAYEAEKYNQIRYVEKTTEAESAKQRLKQLNARSTDRGLTITLNAASLCDQAWLRDMKKLADFLKQYPQYRVSIEGHADSSGNRSVKQGISDRRSYAVRMALIDRGINGGRIRARGFADAFPVADNNTVIGRRLNRRVEIVFSDEYGNLFPYPNASRTGLRLSASD
ncbi:MAG: OmpA family protein [Methylobacter sp.]